MPVFDIPDRLVTLPAMSEVTRILARAQQGDPQAAEELFPIVYDELHATVDASFQRDALERLVRLYESWNTTAPNAATAAKSAASRQKLAALENARR